MRRAIFPLFLATSALSLSLVQNDGFLPLVPISKKGMFPHLLHMRGGNIVGEASAKDEYDEYDLDYSEGEEEDEDDEKGDSDDHESVYDEVEESGYDDESEEAGVASLSSSTLASVAKSKERETAEIKSAIRASLKDSNRRDALAAGMKKRKKKGLMKSLLKVLRMPYIIRASLNPFTVFAMTRAYFASLFNISYLEEDSSHGLRSALEEKAKKGGGAQGGRRGKRAMRPGQAKTLSDLPQLSA